VEVGESMVFVIVFIKEEGPSESIGEEE